MSVRVGVGVAWPVPWNFVGTQCMVTIIKITVIQGNIKTTHASSKERQREFLTEGTPKYVI